MKEWVYATPSKAIATIFLSSKGNDLYYKLSGAAISEKIELVERKPHMFKSIFDCSGYIYKLDSKNFLTGLTNWSGEVVSLENEKVISYKYISNVYDELIKLNNDGKIKLYLYPNRPQTMH